MKSFIAVLCLAAVASASWVGHGVHHHVPSGSVGVSHDGAVIAGPSGSVRTDNGLHGHGAGAVLSGPAGDVATHGGHARLAGPGIGHHGHVAVVAPVIAAPVAVGHWGHGAWGNGAWGNGAWGHAGLAHGLVGGWGHGAVVSHGLVGHGHHGW